MKAVIIAAGMSSRIKSQTQGTPKTLLPYGKGTILSTIIENIASTGITEFVIVVGFQSQYIISYLEKNNYFGYTITIVQNDEWKRANGVSVLAAEQAVDGGNFLLSMSDHIVSSGALKQMVESNPAHNCLLVDKQTDDVLDIDDATKVKVNADSITHIGKEISDYNGIDCGIFRLTPRFFDAMRTQLNTENESISAAISKLISADDMFAVFIDKEFTWFDIDTPEDYQHYVR